MARKRHKPEEIVAKLRQVDVLTAQGTSVAEAVRSIGVTEVTYYRWRQEYGGLKTDQVRRMKELETPCCMDRRCGRIEPYPCSGSCGADILRASQLQHSVQHVGGDRHLGCLSPVGLEAQPVTDDPFPSRDVGLHQSTPAVPRG